MERLVKASDDRIYRLKDAIRLGIPEKTIKKLTGIDSWFIKEIKQLCNLEEELVRYNLPEDIPFEFFKLLKQSGILMPKLRG
jgi:carbamoyl-phosphate synthase large subunit